MKSPYLRYAPGLSLAFASDIPSGDVIYVNGNWFGPVIGRGKKDTIHLFDYTTHKLPYVVSLPSNVLILDGGTGLHADYALWNGVLEVTLVEENRKVLNLLRNQLVSKNDSLFYHPKLKVANMHSRSFLMTDTISYDLIVLPSIESFGGSSGIDALQEKHLFTLEALDNIWEHLTPNGMVEITSWMDYPFRNPLKVLATLVETLEQKGYIRVAENIVSIRSWGTITFVLKKTPFTASEILKIKQFCDTMYFDPVLLPNFEPYNQSEFNQLEDSSFFSFVNQIVSSSRSSFYQQYDFNVRPATDDRPYFSQFLKINRLGKLYHLLGKESLPFIEIGYFITLLTFVQISFVTFLIVLFPLFFTKWQGGGKAFTLLYFSGIGMGFMFIEIIFIQQFILYFGHPVIAASAVLSGMLISSGVGSLVTGQIENNKRSRLLLLSLVVLFIVFYAFALTPILRASIDFSLSVKILFSLLLIFPVAFFMGMPFPVGLKHLNQHNNTLIPWAWGVNGSFSVVSTVLATIIAVEVGYFWVLICASVAYGIALVASLLKL